MSKKKVIKQLVDQINLISVDKQLETVTFDIDAALMVHLPPKIKSKLVQAVKDTPEKAERLVRIANMVEPSQLEYTIDKNLY